MEGARGLESLVEEKGEEGGGGEFWGGITTQHREAQTGAGPVAGLAVYRPG
jgi:hypothetical protein